MDAKKPMNLIHVWSEKQRVPATSYGNANYGEGNYEIRVNEDAAQAKEQQGGIVYHFSPSGGGGGR